MIITVHTVLQQHFTAAALHQKWSVSWIKSSHFYIYMVAIPSHDIVLHYDKIPFTTYFLQSENALMGHIGNKVHLWFPYHFFRQQRSQCRRNMISSTSACQCTCNNALNQLEGLKGKKLSMRPASLEGVRIVQPGNNKCVDSFFYMRWVCFIQLTMKELQRKWLCLYNNMWLCSTVVWYPSVIISLCSYIEQVGA